MFNCSIVVCFRLSPHPDSVLHTITLPSLHVDSVLHTITLPSLHVDSVLQTLTPPWLCTPHYHPTLTTCWLCAPDSPHPDSVHHTITPPSPHADSVLHTVSSHPHYMLTLYSLLCHPTRTTCWLCAPYCVTPPHHDPVLHTVSPHPDSVLHTVSPHHHYMLTLKWFVIWHTLLTGLDIYVLSQQRKGRTYIYIYIYVPLLWHHCGVIVMSFGASCTCWCIIKLLHCGQGVMKSWTP